MKSFIGRVALLSDLPDILHCFESSVRGTCGGDYNLEQIEAWLSGKNNKSRWEQAIENQYFLVAVHGDDEIAGFGSLTVQGELDFLYVAPDWQGKGIASSIVNRLIERARELNFKELRSYASLTATPFFISKGFSILRENRVEIDGQELRNNLVALTI